MVDCIAAKPSHLARRHAFCISREAANVRVVIQLAKNMAKGAKLSFGCFSLGRSATIKLERAENGCQEQKCRQRLQLNPRMGSRQMFLSGGTGAVEMKQSSLCE